MMNSGWRPLGLPEGEVERLIGRLENERPTQISTKSRSPHDPDPAEPPFRKRLRRSQEICGSKILLSTYEVSGNCNENLGENVESILRAPTIRELWKHSRVLQMSRVVSEILIY